MYTRGKLFATLIIGFLLLLFSLYVGSKSIKKTSEIIDYIEIKQLKLSSLVYTLNYEIQSNRSNILQTIITDKSDYKEHINESFNHLNNIIDIVDNFIVNNRLKIKALDDQMGVIKKRMVGYRAVEDSLIVALASKEIEDIEDALSGFESTTVKFSQDLNHIIGLSNISLSNKIVELKNINNKSQIDIFYAFILALILIVFSIYKLVRLQNNLNRELNRAEEAEREQIILQEKLKQYNNNLKEEIAKVTDELHKKVYTHSLSGLANRNKLFEDIRIYKFKQLALLNIDKFQKFNDVYGEDIGNIAIIKTAKFLNEQIDDEDILLYHISGDEFVYGVKNSTSSYDTHFVKEIDKILSNYSKKVFTYKDKTFNLMMSAGVDFSAKEKMLAYADMALKDAKRNNVQLSIYNEDKKIEKIHKDGIECHKKLLHAFDSGGVTSFFQPIVPIQNKDLPIKYESLIRIIEDNKNIIAPFRFIEVAKQNRVYYKLTKIVTINTLNTIAKYKIPCSLNISMKDIENERTLAWIYEQFDNFDFNELLTIELLETEEFKDYKIVFDFCLKVRSYGIKIALDDFGSGYANFTHILKLPIDYIKIDASLISNIDRDHQSRIMVETIVELAHKLNVLTIAEFVSSKEILVVVKKLGVDYSQGFYTGKPEPIEKHLATHYL